MWRDKMRVKDAGGRKRKPRGRSRQSVRALVHKYTTPVVLLLLLAGMVVLGQGENNMRAPGAVERTHHHGDVYVRDGDSLAVDGREYRIWGIDAPEFRQLCFGDNRRVPCGEYAANYMGELVGRGDVSCEEKDTDRYGRVVARCFRDDRDIGREMVQAGWALAYRQYSGDLYAADERAARREKRGVWAYEFDKPWEWRQRNRD